MPTNPLGNFTYRLSNQLEWSKSMEIRVNKRFKCFFAMSGNAKFSLNVSIANV